MKYLKLFESNIEDKIYKEDIEDIFLPIIDIGYELSIEEYSDGTGYVIDIESTNRTENIFQFNCDSYDDNDISTYFEEIELQQNHTKEFTNNIKKCLSRLNNIGQYMIYIDSKTNLIHSIHVAFC